MIECSICKTHNEDRSLYCLECGQRLKPKGSSNSDLATADVLPTFKQEAHQSSSKLHSPMLDIAEQSSGRRNKSANNQFNVAESISEDQNSRPMGISRNGLHSPLLDRRNYFPNPYPEPDSGVAEPAESNNRNLDKSRLHSPVLDGPGSASGNMAHSRKNFAAEEPEYESLRSPLLKSKVPLPEVHLTEIHTEATQSIQSILSAVSSPAANNTAANNTAANSAVEAPNKTNEPFLSFTGINSSKNAANSAPASAPNKRPPLSVSQSLLPADRERPDAPARPTDENKSTFNQVLFVPLIFLALGFKLWFLSSLGNTLFSSAPFAFDQAGQILVLVLILALVLSRKN